MWVQGVSDNHARFSVVYRSMIKAKLRKQYKESRAEFLLPLSYENIEKEIKGLLGAYPSKPYRSVALFSDHKLSNASITKRLNSFAYALSNLEMDAYYTIENVSPFLPEINKPSSMLYPMRIINFILLCSIFGIMYWFGYISLQHTIYLCIASMIIMYMILYKL